MRTDDIQVSTIYTFSMSKVVFIQLVGVEKAISMNADKVERTEPPQAKLLIKAGDKQIGKFRIDQVAGWWIQD